jgi:hypothetical protein
MLPKACLNHKNFIVLSPHALKLFIDLYANYNGYNNGDFCCTWSMMKKRGWKSESTLSKARKELLYYGWIIYSRHGGRNRASLYAVTFQAINDCKGKLDIKETVTSPGDWKETKQLTWKEYQNKSLLCNVVQLTTPPVVKVWEKPCFTTQLLRLP